MSEVGQHDSDITRRSRDGQSLDHSASAITGKTPLALLADPLVRFGVGNPLGCIPRRNTLNGLLGAVAGWWGSAARRHRLGPGLTLRRREAGGAESGCRQVPHFVCADKVNQRGGVGPSYR